MEAVKSFMMRPEIYRYAVEFGCRVQDHSFISTDSDFWLSYRQDNELIGLINVHVITGAMCQFHPYILHKHKDGYNRMVLEFFKTFKEIMPENMAKLNAYIPVVFNGAIKAAKQAGMVEEGIDRQSYLTSKGAIDRIMFGKLREDM